MSRLIVLGLACVALTGCVVGPDATRPDLRTAEAFTGQPADARARLRADWYRDFADPQLDRLAERALRDNIDIAIARANLDIARANVRRSRASLFPTLDAFLSTQLSGDLTGDVDSRTGATSGLGLGFDADIAGRNTRQLEAARAAREASAFSLADTRRLILEALVLDYIAFQRAGARLALLDENLDLQARTLEIVTARYNAGLSPKLDVDRASADLARSRAQRGLLEADQRQALFRLNILMGDNPASVQMAGDDGGQIPIYRGLPAAGLRNDLLRNRPDVRRAEAVIVADTARIGVEMADLDPSLRLPGTLTGRAGDGADEVTFGVSALLDVPLFDFGARRADVDAQRARAAAAFSEYRLTVLEAQREVEAALAVLAALQDRRAELERAGSSSQSAYDQLDALYREGLAGFIDVLDAQRTLIGIREQLVETDASLASTYAQLNAALGGFPEADDASASNG